MDEKALARIEDVINKYELESWQKFLKIQEDFQESLFSQHAISADGMTPTEFHKVFVKWQKVARKSLPASIRPADSISALQYIIDRDNRNNSAKEGGGGLAADAAGKPAVVVGAADGDADTTTAGAAPAEEKMTYRLWADVVNGKHRPDEHRTAPAAR